MDPLTVNFIGMVMVHSYFYQLGSKGPPDINSRFMETTYFYKWGPNGPLIIFLLFVNQNIILV